MSISPFQPDDRPLQNWQAAVDLSKDDDTQAAQPLTLSQALTITAGLAGLIGLLSGVVIRFSLANSSNARFLSPLQTFPALSDWAPERPQETADSHYLPAGTQRDTWEGASDSSRSVDFDAFGGGDFDSFANRNESNEPLKGANSDDPWETLRKGPRLSERDGENGFLGDEDVSADELAGEDSTYFDETAEDPYYSEDSYLEDSYSEGPYGEDPYAEDPGSDDSFDEWSSEPFIDEAGSDRYEE